MAVVLNGTTNDITINGVSVATDTEVNSAVAPKANTADLKEIGVGQTWQDVTASRVSNTTYTNSTGKPIIFQVRSDQSSSCTININGLSMDAAISSAGMNSVATYIIPNGHTYSYTYTGTSSGKKIYELR